MGKQISLKKSENQGAFYAESCRKNDVDFKSMLCLTLAFTHVPHTFVRSQINLGPLLTKPAENLVVKAPNLTFALLKKGYQMANHKATKKDVRQAAKRRERNKYYGKTTRNAIRDLKEEKGAEMGKKLPVVAAMIDKLAKRGIIHKNKAANLKSKLTRKANAAK